MTVTGSRTARSSPAPKEDAPSGPDPLTSHTSTDTHLAAAGEGKFPPATADGSAIPKGDTPWLADPAIDMAAVIVDDLEKVRIANENRLRQLIKGEADVDKDDRDDRGFGLMPPGIAAEDEKLDEKLGKVLAAVQSALAEAHESGRRIRVPDRWHEDVFGLSRIILQIRATEADAVANLERVMKRHPLYPWVESRKGVGAKTVARLLGAIGDPYWNSRDDLDRPRTVSELWAYCGYHTIGGRAAKRARGEKANWSADAKKRAWLIYDTCHRQVPCKKLMAAAGDEEGFVPVIHAEGCDCSPYRVLYDAERARLAGALHFEECPRCGPKNKPAPLGSPLSAKHQDYRARRKVTKEILKDLWREAKRLHDQ